MLKQLTLTNFRNYDHAEIELSGGLNCIVGSNGMGKTNILEAVYYLSLLRSFRTSNLNELLQWKAASFTVRGVIPCVGLPDTALAVNYGKERRLFQDGQPVYRACDFINRFLCITFIPEDLFLVQGAPALRRRFLDIANCQLSMEYLRHLQSYQAILQSRNVMLKDRERNYPREMLTIYDDMLAKEGAAIEWRRRCYCDQLNEQLEGLSGKLLGDQRLLSVKYLSRIGGLLQEHNASEEELRELLAATLKKSFDHDLATGTTNNGPHRSDFSCLLGNVRLVAYGSQGECRMGSLALRLACLGVVRQNTGAQEVTLLVDDVVGELDAQRRQHFLEAISGVGQTLFACTELPPSMAAADKVIRLNYGSVV